MLLFLLIVLKLFTLDVFIYVNMTIIIYYTERMAECNVTPVKFIDQSDLNEFKCTHCVVCVKNIIDVQKPDRLHNWTFQGR